MPFYGIVLHGKTENSIVLLRIAHLALLDMFGKRFARIYPDPDLFPSHKMLL